jgi:membrane protein
MSLLDRKLVKVEIAHLPHGSKVLIPIMKVPKELFSNVDTESGSGQALHLCRKHVNVQVVAHIIVGICAMFDMDRDGDELVFDLAIDYLYAGSENRVQAIQKVALNHNIQSTGILDCFLAELQNLYIQCIEIDPRESACEIIKIRSTMANDIPDQSAPALTRNTIPTKQLKGAELPETLHNSPKLLASLQNFLFSKAPLLARSFISTALDLSGIKATRLEIKDPPIGEGVHPTHMRIISPRGTLIDDVAIIRRSDSKFLISHPKVGIFFRQDRAIIWDSGLSIGEYFICMKVNPKRGTFLIPAAFGMFTQMILTVLCLRLGPATLDRNDASLGGALLLLPSFLAFFASRDTEHELLSRILGLPRLLTVLSAISSILCGALIFTLPPACTSSRVSGGLFIALIITFYLSSTTLVLLIFQISRISLIRSLLRRKKRKPLGSGESGIRFSKKEYGHPLPIAIFVAIIVLVMIVLYSFPVFYILWRHGGKWGVG